MTASNPRFPLFDSLRAIAALLVFGVHLPWVYRLGADNAAFPYLQQLNAGVSVFFLISGFLLYRPFARARFAGDARPSLGAYATRRGLRIFPAYWVALVFVVILVGASGEADSATPVFSTEGFFRYLALMQVYDSETLLGGISAAWTLSVELSFYALLPLWAWLMSRIAFRGRRGFVTTELAGLSGLFAIGVAWTVIGALRTGPSAVAFVDVTVADPWLYLLPGYLDQFALGMGLAVVSIAVADAERKPLAVKAIDRASWIPWLVAALAFAALGNVHAWFDTRAAAILAIHELQAVFAFALLLPAVFGDPERGLVRRVLANRVLLWIGLVSYGVYLWHVAVQRELLDLGALASLGELGYTLLALAGTLAAAAASFYFVERPALRLGRRVSHRDRSQDADMRMRDLLEHERSEAERTQPVKP
jgi:peptidoglycan/LPS O-acetylase OafA/YrhL